MENSSYWFDGLFDIKIENTTIHRSKIPGLVQLLGGKYNISTDPNATNIVDQVTEGDQTLYITEGKAFPIGFSPDKYLYTSELVSLPQEQRALALMNAVVINPEDEKQISDVMEHIDINTIDFDASIDDLIASAS